MQAPAKVEAQRQKRLMQLLDWGRANIKKEETREEAVTKLRESALRQFGVSYITATNYAKVVAWKLKPE